MVDHRTRKVILVICVVLLLIFVASFVGLKVKYSSYLSTEAQIIDVYTQKSTRTNSNSKTHYVVYEYQVDGKDYTTRRQVFSTIGYKEGSAETIRFDSQDPARIENTLLVNTVAAVGIFVAVFTVCLWLIIRKSRFT